MNKPRSEALQLPEDGNSISRDRDDAGLVHDLLVEGLHGVQVAGHLAGGDVKPHLHQGDWRIVILGTYTNK